MEGTAVNADSFDELKRILGETLEIRERVASFDASTPLFGSLPELDSMSVITLITAIEERFGVVFDDDEITAEAFATLGGLHQLLAKKLST